MLAHDPMSNHHHLDQSGGYINAAGRLNVSIGRYCVRSLQGMPYIEEQKQKLQIK